MIKYLIFFTYLIFLTSCGLLQPELNRSPASPSDEQNYEIRNAGTINQLPNNSVVEGSLRFGGLQPDYIIDRDHPDMKILIKVVKSMTSETDDFWTKVGVVTEFVKETILPKSDYDDADYLALLERYRSSGADIPLSEYVSCKAGVCRESALITHILLDEIGIENFHLYVHIQQYARFVEPEDHALIIVKHGDELWTVDSYNSNFNGFLLEDLLEGGADDSNPRVAPIAEEFFPYRKILKIYNFPRVWIPKGRAKGCRDSLNDLLNRR